MFQEIWKDVNGFPGYQISDYGRVRSLGRCYKRKIKDQIIQQRIKGRILSPNDNGKGYWSVQLGRNNRKYIHRLVAIHFLDNPNNYTEINHKNADKTNNSFSNLEWCNRQMNIDHSVSMGLNNKILDENKVKKIKGMLSEGIKQIDIAKQFNVTRYCISDIKCQKTWKHVI